MRCIVVFSTPLFFYMLYMGKQKIQSAFTLVELIVVIAVLAVLAAIAFSTVGNISSSARDSARLTDVSQMRSALDAYRATKGVYPQPDDVSTIIWSGSTA